MSAPAPLLDFFRRGEAAREVRLLAAQGVLAPRAHEQVALLVLLVNDRDAEIRETALRTIDSIPVGALRAYLGRDDVPTGIREFFGDRGILPAEAATITDDAPLFDQAADTDADADTDDESSETLLQKIQGMGFTDRIRAAMRGSREMRAILIRDPNKMIATAVLSSPKVSDAEIESFAKMATVSEEILRTIASSRTWVKNYGVVVALTRNSKTPLGLSLNLLNRLNDRDLAAVSNDRNIPDPLRIAARRKVALGSKG